MITQREMDLMELEAETRLNEMLDDFMDAWLGERAQWLDTNTDYQENENPISLLEGVPNAGTTGLPGEIPGTPLPRPSAPPPMNFAPEVGLPG